MLEAFYDWAAARSPIFKRQRFLMTCSEAKADGLRTSLESKENQVAELQRAVSGLQRSRDRVKAHNDFLKRSLDEAYKTINRLTGEAAEAEANHQQYLDRAQSFRRDVVKQVVKDCLSKKITDVSTEKSCVKEQP
jgi:chromosome segregation ATPase